MKKVLALLLSAVICASITACTDNSEDTQNTSVPETTVQVATTYPNEDITSYPAVENETITTPFSKDYVDDFFAITGEIVVGGLSSGLPFDEEHCFNVTPKDVAEQTDFEIFKFSLSDASFIMFENKVYQLCASFGGYGFFNAVPCDFDNDGNLDLLVASSWGSGLHRSEISVFNSQTKESTVIFSSATTEEPSVDLTVSKSLDNDMSVYTVHTIDIKRDMNSDDDNSVSLTYSVCDVYGTVKAIDDIPVFLHTEPQSFSYAEDSSYWKEGEVGMKTKGFKNTTEQQIQNAEDAIALAKNEVTVPFNLIFVNYDKENSIWKVSFGMDKQLGGNQNVYLNSNGTTKMCIWEE